MPSVSAATPIAETPMMFPVFILIASITLFCLLIGLGAGIPFFNILGFFLVFVIGFTIQGGQLYLPTGELYYVYGDNFTLENGSPTYHWDYGDPPTPGPQDDVAWLFHKNKEYEPWDTGNYHEIGWFFMIIGIMAAIFNLFFVFGGND